MSVAEYIEILKNIERDTASHSEWRQLSKKMIAALPARLYRQYPLDLQQVAPKKPAATRHALWTDTFPALDCSSSDSSDSEKEEEGGEENKDYEDCDLGHQVSDPSFPSLPPGRLARVRPEVEQEVLAIIATMRICKTPRLHRCPRVLWPERKGIPIKTRADRTRVCAFRALKAFTETPFGNGMSGLRSETCFDLDKSDVGVGEGLVKVDSWRLAEDAAQRLDWRTGEYDVEDLDLYDDIDGQLEIYGPRAEEEEEVKSNDEELEDFWF